MPENMYFAQGLLGVPRELEKREAMERVFPENGNNYRPRKQLHEEKQYMLPKRY